MDVLVAWAAAPAVFALAWYFLGYAEARASGLVSLLAGAFLIALSLPSTLSATQTAMLPALSLILGLYLMTEGSVALWNLGSRTVGFLAGYAALAIGVLGALQILIALTSDPFQLSTATVGLAALLFVPPALIRFVHQGLGRPALRRLAGWSYLLSAWVGWAIPGAIILINDSLG